MRTCLFVVAVLAAGCGQEKSGSHCTLGNTCEEFPTGDVITHEKDCKVLTGDWAKGRCPTDNLVGACATSGGQTHRYYSGGTNAYTTVTATANCEHELHGTWSAN